MQEIFIHKSEKVKGELKNIDQVLILWNLIGLIC